MTHTRKKGGGGVEIPLGKTGREIFAEEILIITIDTHTWRKLGTDVSFVVVMSPPLFMQTTFVLFPFLAMQQKSSTNSEVSHPYLLI